MSDNQKPPREYIFNSASQIRQGNSGPEEKDLEGYYRYVLFADYAALAKRTLELEQEIESHYDYSMKMQTAANKLEADLKDARQLGKLLNKLSRQEEPS